MRPPILGMLWGGGEDPPVPGDVPLEDSPLDEGSSEADHLDPEPGASAESIVVMGLAAQEKPAEEPALVDEENVPPPPQSDTP